MSYNTVAVCALAVAALFVAHVACCFVVRKLQKLLPPDEPSTYDAPSTYDEPV